MSRNYWRIKSKAPSLQSARSKDLPEGGEKLIAVPALLYRQCVTTLRDVCHRAKDASTPVSTASRLENELARLHLWGEYFENGRLESALQVSKEGQVDIIELLRSIGTAVLTISSMYRDKQTGTIARRTMDRTLVDLLKEADSIIAENDPEEPGLPEESRESLLDLVVSFELEEDLCEEICFNTGCLMQYAPMLRDNLSYTRKNVEQSFISTTNEVSVSLVATAPAWKPSSKEQSGLMPAYVLTESESAADIGSSWSSTLKQIPTDGKGKRPRRDPQTEVSKGRSASNLIRNQATAKDEGSDIVPSLIRIPSPSPSPTHTSDDEQENEIFSKPKTAVSPSEESTNTKIALDLLRQKNSPQSRKKTSLLPQFELPMSSPYEVGTPSGKERYTLFSQSKDLEISKKEHKEKTFAAMLKKDLEQDTTTDYRERLHDIKKEEDLPIFKGPSQLLVPSHETKKNERAEKSSATVENIRGISHSRTNLSRAELFESEITQGEAHRRPEKGEPSSTHPKERSDRLLKAHLANAPGKGIGGEARKPE